MTESRRTFKQNKNELSSQSPVGDDLIKTALINIPKLPTKFDKRNATVTGVNSTERSLNERDPTKRNFSKFMLERLKKQSILNHSVFQEKGVDYREQVERNYKRYQEIIKNGGGVGISSSNSQKSI